MNEAFDDNIRTEEVEDEPAVGSPAGGITKVGLPVGRLGGSPPAVTGKMAPFPVSVSELPNAKRREYLP